MRRKIVKNTIAQRILRDVPKNHFTPRSYEWELLHAALSKDTILCCGNDDAKVFIILSLFKEKTFQLANEFQYSIYLSDSVADVEWTAQYLRQQLLVDVISLTDKAAVDRWAVGDKSRAVLSLTPNSLQRLLFDLEVFQLSQVNIMIIDHCHIILSNLEHPYARVMNEIQMLKSREEQRPQILAFTDALYDLETNDPLEMENRLSQLEDVLHCRAETASELLNIFVYGVRPREIMFQYSKYKNETSIGQFMERTLLSTLKFLNDIDGQMSFVNRSGVEVDVLHYVTRAVQECENTLQELGPFCCSTVARVFMKHLLASEHQCMEEMVKRLMRFVITQFGLIIRFFRVYYDRIMSLEEFVALIPQKVRLLIEQIKSYRPRVQFTIEVDETSSMESQDSEFDSDLDLEDDVIEEPERRITRGRSSRRRHGYRGSRNSSRSSISSRASISSQMNYRAVLNDESIEPDDDKFNALILVGSQFTAYTLSRLIDELCIWDSEMYYVKPGHFYGPSKHQQEQQEEDNEKDDEDDQEEQTNRPNVRNSLLNRYQEETMRKFRMGHINVLFATGLTGSTAEENNFCLQLDIPKCNLLMRFDPPPQTFVDYVYCKTRVKAERASYVFIVKAGEPSKAFSERYRQYREVESVLVNRCAAKDSFDKLGKEETEGDGSAVSWQRSSIRDRVIPEKMLKPFVVPTEDGARLSMDMAIGLVNKYCASLPSDAYSQLVPTWWLKTAKTGVRCHIKLPMNSPMNWEIVGDEMPNSLMAKMAAAQRCCEALHSTGELTNQLEPVGKEKQLQQLLHPEGRNVDERADDLRSEPHEEVEESIVITEVRDDDDVDSQAEPEVVEAVIEETVDEAEAEDECNEGVVSVKRRQFYYKKVADCLQNCFPRADETCHLYLLHLRLEVPLPAEVTRINRDLFYPETASQSFGLLSRDSIRDIPSFPVFTRSGEVQVSLRLVTKELVLTEDELKRLVDFHRLIFRRVLRLEKDAVMSFQCEQAYAQTLIVPLHCESDASDAWIDWDFLTLVEEAERLPAPCKIPPRRFPDSNIFDFRAEDYKDAIVMPTYRNFDQPQHYYVAEIRNDLSPKDSFPSDIYHTFEDYYCRKYNAKVTNHTQPLLDVDFTVMRLNLVIPRHVNHHGHVLHSISAESRRLRSESLNQKQLLLPELTYRHPVPASLWRKAVCLPTILYRINYLLLADEIRCRVAREANVGRSDEDESEKPSFSPMTFRYSAFNSGSGSISSATTEGPINLQTVPNSNGDGWSLLDGLSESKLVSDKEVAERRQVIEKSKSGVDDDFGVFIGPNEEEEALEREKEETEIATRIDSETAEKCPDDADLSIEDDESIDSFEGDVTFFRDSEDFDDNAEFGPSPVALLEALTMSNANDFFNYERLETLGDSFLKFAVTVHYYCSSGAVHEGQLSRLRSRQVSNFNLYRLGRAKSLHEMMVGYKFEPAENWIPPGYIIHYDARLHEAGLPVVTDPPSSPEKKDNAETETSMARHVRFGPAPPKGVPYYLRIQHSLPDKSVADCVEALLGCYLTSCGEVAALRVMKWLGIEVGSQGRDPDTGELLKYWWPKPKSPLLHPLEGIQPKLEAALWGYDEFEKIIQYKFNDRSYLLQAFTHASFTDNTMTDCYQKLEFLGDAILDYVVTRYLFEDSKNHSPGVLTDLRSALVNNHIFAGLAVKWGFHKFFRCYSPTLWRLIQRFVEYQKITQEDDLDFITSETELYSGEDDREDVEIPKALGDIFESVAGAVYLDSGNCLDTVWRVFLRLMRERIERYTACIPKSPVRELLEMYPEATSFERPKRTSRGKICVCVRVVNRGRYYGIGRNYRIAKSAAAKRALSALKTNPIPSTAALLAAINEAKSSDEETSD